MISILVFNQVSIMLILMGIGYLAVKVNFLSKVGSKDMSMILMYIVTPAVLIDVFRIESSPEKTQMLLFSLGIGFISLTITFILAFVIEHKHPLLQFAISFTNVGFIGIPLIYNTLGPEAVFYMVPYLILQILSVWTIGIYMITGDKSKVSFREISSNPVIWFIFIGFFLYLFQIQLPNTMISVVDFIKPMNAPFAMFVIGALLTEVSFKDMMSDTSIYKAIVTRLLIAPLMIAIIFVLLPGASDLHFLTKTAILIVSAAPSAANTAILAHMFDLSSEKAVKMVTLSTLLSVLTMPFIIYVFEQLLTIFTSGN